MKKLVLIFAILIYAQFNLSDAQQMKIITNGEAEFLPEFNGVVLFEKNKFVINLNIPANMRSKEYQNVDLQTGDEIQFVNGKKIKTIKDFRKYYSELKPGDEVKFGIVRDNQRYIIPFKKGSMPKDDSEGANGGAVKQKIQVINGKVFINGKEANLDSLKKAGVNIKVK